MQQRIVLAGIVLAAAFSAGAPAPAGDVKEPILIGMPETMIVDSADAVDVLKERLTTLMKEFTGLQGKLEIEKGPFEMAKKLEDKQLHLGSFQGIEFAWVQKKHPKLKMFMVSLIDTNDADKAHQYVQLLVRDKAPEKSFADLKGKTLAYPKKSKEHVRVFLQKNIGDAPPATFFKAVVTSASVEGSLDELVNEKLDAVVADKTAVDFYKSLKPGAFRKLRVVQTSEAFPVGVVAYLEGGMDAKTLERIEKGLLKANKSERGQDLMGSWGIAAFQPVPADLPARSGRHLQGVSNEMMRGARRASEGDPLPSAKAIRFTLRRGDPRLRVGLPRLTAWFAGGLRRVPVRGDHLARPVLVLGRHFHGDLQHASEAGLRLSRHLGLDALRA